jgi:23S rRNA pseudouridine1911/1915/1917 synthase
VTSRHFVLGPEQRRERVDKVLSRLLGEVSRATVQRWIDEDRVKVDGKPCRAKDSVSAGTSIDVEPGPAPTSNAEPDQSVILDVQYEDAHLLVVNKPAGWSCIPLAGTPRGRS